MDPPTCDEMSPSWSKSYMLKATTTSVCGGQECIEIKRNASVVKECIWSVCNLTAESPHVHRTLTLVLLFFIVQLPKAFQCSGELRQGELHPMDGEEGGSTRVDEGVRGSKMRSIGLPGNK